MKSKIKRTYLITLSLLLAGTCCAQSPTRKELRFDLSKIGFVMDGHQVCEDKGRLQDYPSKVMNQIISAQQESVPVLIGMLTDARIVKTEEPIICFWGQMNVSDLAFCVLGDLFLESGGNTTIPGAGWDEMLGPAGDLPAWEQLHRFVRIHGRKGLQDKWQKLWDKYGSQVAWDSKERCFKLKVGK